VTLRLELVERGSRWRRRRRAYHRRVVDGTRGRALIGRVAESARLAEAYTRASVGESRIVIVAGEAGIGKTHLVDVFVDTIAAGGGRVLSGGCLALGSGGLPYGPFVEAFRALLRDVDPGALPALLGPNRGELARLMPEVRGRPDRLEADPGSDAPDHAAADDRFAQVRLFELVLGVFQRLARVAPLVLVVEDLQWADPSTRDLLAFLVRNLRDERVLLIATVRTDELDPRHAFMAYLAELERGERVDRIDLARLSRDDLSRLLADELGHEPDPALVDRTWERTGGNPFYAEQILAVSQERDDGDLPARLRDVVLARVGAVPETGQEVLRVASAAGTRIDDELLVAVAELAAPVVREALRDVVDRRILVPAGGAADPHYVFCHALLQEVIHGELFPGERARLHAGYAAALETRSADRAAGRRGTGPPPSAAELAYHWDAAGDEPRALPATIEAGRAAERAYAYLEAHRHYLRALELWERAGEPEASVTADRVDILVRAAETAVLIGEYGAAVEFGRQAIASVDASADLTRASGLQERQRWYLWEAGDRVAAEAAVVEAERLVPKHPPSAARARILAHHAGILMSTGRFAESIPMAEDAIEVARAVGSSSDEALGLGILGWDLALIGRVDDGLERVRAGLAIADELGGAEGIALGATNLAILLDRVGRTEEALTVSSSGWERAKALGVERTYGGLLLAVSAKTAIALGRWDEADAFLTLGLAHHPLGAPGIRLRIQRGRLDTFRGDILAATAALADARAADEAAGGTEDRAALVAALADLAAAAGRVTETRAAVTEGLRLAAGGMPDPALAQLAATGLRVEADNAARARARHDDAALEDARRRARQIAVQVERIAALLGVPDAASELIEPSRRAVLTALCRAEAARLDERDEPDRWTRVADGFDAIGRPYPAAYARFRAAAATLRAKGPRGDARAALAAARATSLRLGARPLLAEIDLLARQARLDLQAGDDTTPKPSDDPDASGLGLTGREGEVLRLIAAGWSNQEIADSLFISRKTASVHASNIFDKLGAANRAEAAAIAHRLGLVGDAPPPPRARD
jgi:DNA-binding CsgD family transcriptional regulator/tetratricopeptide (TPR) repeat protein